MTTPNKQTEDGTCGLASIDSVVSCNKVETFSS